MLSLQERSNVKKFRVPFCLYWYWGRTPLPLLSELIISTKCALSKHFAKTTKCKWPSRTLFCRWFQKTSCLYFVKTLENRLSKISPLGLENLFSSLSLFVFRSWDLFFYCVCQNKIQFAEVFELQINWNTKTKIKRMFFNIQMHGLVRK